ncbi:hypothetical protein EVA_22244 [gut metagenome]|uniref:Uncharacterized protein n=1 Tax=gut metagenome TaxID=749906 RepID=J9FQL1_9ZZZZ
MIKQMTRAEAKLVAEELFKLIKKDRQLGEKLVGAIRESVAEEMDEYFDTKSAAEFLGVSVHYIYKNIDDIPHTNIGKLHKFKRSSLAAFRSRI